MSQSLFARLTRRFEPKSALERREFLKLALAAAASFLASGPELLATSSNGRRAARRVIVVGGGFAGLSCAHELHRAGCRVTVLESRKRVGGRVLSLSDVVAGKMVEGGGEYIGSNHPTWLAYAHRFHLELFEGSADEDADQPVILGGRRLDNKEAKALLEEMKVGNQRMNHDAAPVVADAPWTTSNAQALDRMNTAQWLRNLPVSRTCKLALGSQLAANNGVALSRQSYLGNLSQVKGGGLEKYWTDSELYRCRGGNQRLAQKLAQTAGDLRLETPVTRIEIKSSGVVVHCANGQALEADDVVLAVPPSVWGQIAFEPGLPHALRPQMGTVMKYLSTVKNAFWKQEHLGPNASTDEMISMTWDGTEGQGSGRAVLTAFSGGPAAVASRRRWAWSGDRPFQEILGRLYRGYSENFLASRFMDWTNDPWTRAGYSFPAPREITTLGPQLRAGQGPLQFAGEHTCYKFVGYMEGALDSGVAAARRVLKQEAKSAAA